jgi:hypothetical protein
MFYREYSKDSDVGHWKGWLENAQGNVIAFVKETGDVIFSW